MSEEERKKLIKKLVIMALRRVSFTWKGRADAIKAARVGRGLYQCNLCKAIVKNKEFRVDHCYPVVDPEKGFTTWDDYIDRMFCESSKFQIICQACHDVKTAEEQAKRKEIKAAKKLALDKSKKV